MDQRKSASLQVQRGGRNLEFKRSSASKKKLACGFASPSSAVSYNGVRMRVWGKWVTEVRDPVTKTRIWLGSFATAEMAARAYDAAMVCLKGASTPEVNFPDSIPSFVIPQSNSSPKEIQAVALAAATASVPAAAPLAMAATPEFPNPPREESHEALPDVTTDRELYRDGHTSENDDVTANSAVSEPKCSRSSSVEDWIFDELEELDAVDNQDAFMEPLKRQTSDSVEQLITTDREFYRDGGDPNYENGAGTSDCDVSEPDCSRSSSVEDWIFDELEELDALDNLDTLDNQDALREPLKRQISDSVEQLLRPWPLFSEDFDCWMIHQDVQLQSFA